MLQFKEHWDSAADLNEAEKKRTKLWGPIE
jgi:hypothetical protein